jgi:RND family efflux transporter MFP subunit
MLALAITFIGCGAERSDEAAPAPSTVAGSTWVVRDTVVSDVLEASGVAEPVQRAMLASKLMARVTEVLVHEGDRVTAGQVVARLDARDLAARNEQAAAGLTSAEAAYREAEAHAARIRALYADSAAPRAQLDQAEAMLTRAEAGVRQARGAGQELAAISDYAVVRAPFAGVVTQRLMDPGAFAAPGQPLLVVEDPSALRLTVTVSPTAVTQVRRGQRLRGTVAGREVEAVVEGVVPAPGGHLVAVNAVARNAEGKWFPGSAATLALPQGVRPGLLIPAAAVVREGDLTGVRLKLGSITELRWVRLGEVSGPTIEVVAGLAAGDTVLVPGEER